jgi:hypothetical protein
VLKNIRYTYKKARRRRRRRRRRLPHKGLIHQGIQSHITILPDITPASHHST